MGPFGMRFHPPLEHQVFIFGNPTVSFKIGVQATLDHCLKGGAQGPAPGSAGEFGCPGFGRKAGCWTQRMLSQARGGQRWGGGIRREAGAERTVD